MINLGLPAKAGPRCPNKTKFLLVAHTSQQKIALIAETHACLMTYTRTIFLVKAQNILSVLGVSAVSKEVLGTFRLLNPLKRDFPY